MEADYSINEKAKPQLRLVIYSAITAVIIQFLVAIIFDQDAFLRRLLSPSDSMFENIVPFTIIFIWIWTMLDISSKARMALKQRKHLQELQIAVHEGKGGDISELDSLHDASQENYPNRRISKLLMQMKTTGDSHQAHEHFSHQLDIDADQSAGGYTLAKVFIWAMPIVGFIGTVSGIGWAVAEFGSFLTSQMTVDDIESIKQALAGIAGGLSYAFDTTLLGLTASIVAMLFMSYVQRNDEGILSDLEQLGLEVLTVFGSKSSKHKKEDDELDIAVDHLLAELNESVERMTSNINVLGNGIPPLFDNVSQTISPLGTKLESSVTELQQAIQAKVSELDREDARSRADVASLHDSLHGISEKLEQICNALTESIPSRDDEHSKADMTLLHDGLHGMSVKLERICDTLAESQNRSFDVQAGEIHLSEDSRNYIGAEVSRLIENISQQVSSTIKLMRHVRMNSTSTKNTEPGRMPLWRAVTVGVALVLLTTVAISSIVSMQKMNALVQNSQLRDAKLSENVMRVAQSIGEARADLKEAMVSFTQMISTPTAAGVNSEQVETESNQPPVTKVPVEASSTTKPNSESKSIVEEQKEKQEAPDNVDEWLIYAETAFVKDYLLTPEDESAIYWVNRVLEVEPHNSKAEAIRSDVIDRYLDWAAKQIQGERIQAAKTSLSKVEALSVHGTSKQKSKLSRLRDELDMLVRKRAERPAAIDSNASVQNNSSTEREREGVNELSTDSETQGTTTDSAISTQQSNEDNSQVHKEMAPGEQAQPQATNNPIKAVGKLFKRVFKNETASEN